MLSENCSFGSYNEVKKEFDKPIVADEMNMIALKLAQRFRVLHSGRYLSCRWKIICRRIDFF